MGSPCRLPPSSRLFDRATCREASFQLHSSHYISVVIQESGISDSLELK